MAYSPDITTVDVFFYVYGLLHSPGLLLLACIMLKLTDPESFIRKTIGWRLPSTPTGIPRRPPGFFTAWKNSPGSGHLRGERPSNLWVDGRCQQ